MSSKDEQFARRLEERMQIERAFGRADAYMEMAQTTEKAVIVATQQKNESAAKLLSEVAQASAARARLLAKQATDSFEKWKKNRIEGEEPS